MKYSSESLLKQIPKYKNIEHVFEVHVYHTCLLTYPKVSTIIHKYIMSLSSYLGMTLFIIYESYCLWYPRRWPLPGQSILRPPCWQNSNRKPDDCLAIDEM